MAYDLEEQEQLAELKAWWATYGKWVLTAAIVVLGALAGWRGYQIWASSRAVNASVMYEQVEQAVQSKDATKVKAAAGALIAQYPSTLYASLSALEAARYYVEAGDLKSAEAQYQWVIDKSGSDEAQALARLRLAGVLLDEKRLDEAQKALAVTPPASFESLFADRRGDIYLAQQKTAEARKEYQTALDKLGPRAGALRSLVQVKLDALGDA